MSKRIDWRLLRDILITVIVLVAGFAYFGTHPRPRALNGEPSADANGAVDAKPLFLRSAADREFVTLTLADLPSVAAGFMHGVVYGDRVYVISDINSTAQQRHLLGYQMNGTLMAQLNPAYGVCDDPIDLAIIGDALFLACRDEGVLEIDLVQERITRTFDHARGLENLQNLELAADGATLWVGTFDGVGQIDTATGTVRFYREALGIPGGQLPAKYGTNVYARNGEVWAQVNANAHSVGGVTRYDAATDTWTPYGPEAFGVVRNAEREYRIDLRTFIVSDAGIFAVYDDKSGVIVGKFAATQGMWEVVARVPAGWPTSDAQTREALPPPEMYRSFESIRTADGTGASFRIIRGGSWVGVPALGRAYLAMTEPIDGTRYVLSTGGLETMTDEDFTPRPIVSSSWGSSSIYEGDNSLIISTDHQYVVAVSRTMDDFFGGVSSYDVGVLSRPTGAFTHARFEASEETSLSDPPPLGEERRTTVAIEQVQDALTITLNGQPLFRFAYLTNTIELIATE
ncbi:MAG: hypothetical protein Q7R80_00305 [bacterium]|nr:hypothetical protein [bacterium]